MPSAAARPTPAHTASGIVLGTVGYMSPEQVRGLAVDHRADLFAFGAILYELLSGQPAFDRQTAPETLTAILNDDPPRLAPSDRAIPPALAHIIDRCLEKKSIGTISDSQRSRVRAGDVVGRAEEPDTADRRRLPPRRPGRRLDRLDHSRFAAADPRPAGLPALREQPVAVDPMRFQIPPAVELAGPGNFNISPDGRHLAFFGLGSDGSARLWLRSCSRWTFRSVAGSEAVRSGASPVLVAGQQVHRV